MQILSINFSDKNKNTVNNNSKKQVNFKRADYLFELKTIPDLTCACCGKKTINPQEMSKIWNRISRPLSQIIDKDLFAYWKNFLPEIYERLVALSEKYPTKTLNSIFLEPEEFSDMKQAFVEIAREETNSPADDNKIVDKPARRLMETLLKTSSGYLKSSDEVIDILKDYESYLQGDQLEAFELLKKYSADHPGYRLSHLIKQYNVIFHHQRQNQKFKNEIDKKTGECFANITRIVKEKDIADQIDISKQHQKAYKLYCTERDPIIRGVKIKEFYSNLLTTNNMEHRIPDVIEQLDKLPTKYRNADSFFVRAYQCDYTDGSIVSSIFEPYIARNINIETREYPRVNSIFNRIITCTSCAQRKGSARSYAEFAKYHDEIHENTQKNFDAIRTYVNERPYLSDIVKSYEKQANAIIEENTNIYELQNHKEFPNYFGGNRS